MESRVRLWRLGENGIPGHFAPPAPPPSLCPPAFVDAELPDPPSVFVAGPWTVSTSGGDPEEIPVTFTASPQAVSIDWGSAQTDPNQLYFDHTSNEGGSYCTTSAGESMGAEVTFDLDVSFSVTDPDNYVRCAIYCIQRRTNGSTFTDEILGSEVQDDRTASGSFTLSTGSNAVNTPGSAVTGLPGWTWTDQVSVQFYIEPTLDAGGTITLTATVTDLSVTLG